MIRVSASEYLPEAGDVVRRGGFPYKVLGETDAVTRDGRTYTAYLVVGQCADCGKSFRFEVPKWHFRKKNQRRRCDQCKRPGIPARPWHKKAAERRHEAALLRREAARLLK